MGPIANVDQQLNRFDQLNLENYEILKKQIQTQTRDDFNLASSLRMLLLNYAEATHTLLSARVEARKGELSDDLLTNFNLTFGQYHANKPKVNNCTFREFVNGTIRFPAAPINCSRKS